MEQYIVNKNGVQNSNDVSWSNVVITLDQESYFANQKLKKIIAAANEDILKSGN